jgi:hypothetical protein
MRGKIRSQLIGFSLVIVLAGLFAGADVLAQGRELADKRDVKHQEFLKRLPLESRCKAEVAGGVLLLDGEKRWKSGPFEVEAEDDFRITIFRYEQLNPDDRETCEAQARMLEYEDIRRVNDLKDGHLLCLRRVYNDKGRLPQLRACRVSALLTQPLHLRCTNLDPIIDPDGVFVSPNLMAVMTLPQAVMTKGTCQAADRF